jgi:hypothetical protein
MLLLSGCNTMFDFAPPGDAGSDLVVTDFRSAADSAGNYAKAYLARAKQIANGFQFFEIPIIGSAVTAVTAAAFRASTDVPLAAGIAGGTFTILEGVYNPRDRTQIYIAAHDSMSCMRRLATLGSGAYQDANLSPSALDSIRTTLAATPNTAPATIASLKKALSVNTDGASEIDDSINAVNASITKQAIQKAARPELQQITTNLKQAAAQTEQNKANNPAGAAAVASNNSSNARRRGLAPAPAPADQAQIQAQVHQILDYAAEFDVNLAACKGLAGSS